MLPREGTAYTVVLAGLCTVLSGLVSSFSPITKKNCQRKVVSEVDFVHHCILVAEHSCFLLGKLDFGRHRENLDDDRSVCCYRFLVCNDFLWLLCLYFHWLHFLERCLPNCCFCFQILVSTL